ncbi:ABC transporter substrate-binding protein/permease [Atopococcus tabaci]|uniref:ABC transporter substrate-binding protein/permease n=1 Tax=Atopococcus tabaci TaxID=269774 RepID=UPI002409C7C2|nr:ABC transporter substrate-binding protein/permease [Atopococcus tabaci]
MRKKGMAVLFAFVMLLQVLVFSPMTAQATTIEEIQDKGTMIIGTSADFPPYEFHAMVDGQDKIVGMDIFIAERIAEELGVELQIEDIGFDSLLPALETGSVDMVIAGMSPTEERRQSVDFSDVYYVGGHNLMVRETDAEIYTGVDSLAGKVVGVQSGSLQEALAAQIPDVELMKLTKITDLILALKTNKVEAIVMEKPNAEAYAGNNPDLYTFDGGFELDESEQGSAIAFQKGSDELVEVVNGVLAEIDEQGLQEEYLAQAGEYLNLENQEEGSFISQYGPYFLNGTMNTIFISIVSVFFGSVLGILLALMRLSRNMVFRPLATAYVEFVRGTPMLIQVMFIYFAVGYLVNIPAMLSGIIAVSLNSAAYICEIIRSGLNSVPSGQTEAARSLGMGHRDTMRHIIFPQALKNIWPALGNEFITVIKESSIVSIIGVSELIFQTRVVTSISYRGVLPLFITMIIYFILTFSLTKLLNYYEGKMKYD